MPITAIYPGSFDPVTMGHIDVVTRASKLFDTIIVGVTGTSNKKQLFEVSQRVELFKEAVTLLPNVKIYPFEGLTVDFAKQHGAKAVIRGLRAISDYEYEFQLSQMNKTLYPELETIFVMASLDYTFLSSTMVKEAFMLGGDVASLVPKPVDAALKQVIHQ